MAIPRSRTSPIASAALIDSAAPSAANSPTEWPTTKSGTIPRARIASLIARLVATSAGCCNLVSSRSSTGPWKQTCLRSSPEASLPASYTAIASGTASAMSRPIPASYEPWPGNMKAILVTLLSSLCSLNCLSIRSARSPT